MKMIGLARLGRDADVRILPSGEKVCNLALAVDYGQRPKEGGNRPTQWYEATLWGERGATLAQYLKKGATHCFTLDDIHIQHFQKQDGSTGYKLSARVVDVELTPRASNQAPQQGQTPPPAQQQQRQAPPPAAAPAPAQAPAPAPAPAPTQAAPAPAPAPAQQQGFQPMDDDIPF